MQFTLLGFNQEMVVELDLNGNDLIVLRKVLDLIHSEKCIHKKFDGHTFYWINYRALVDDLPFLKVDKRGMYRNYLKKLIDKKILESYTDRCKDGVYSYYRTGEKYRALDKHNYNQE